MANKEITLDEMVSEQPMTAPVEGLQWERRVLTPEEREALRRQGEACDVACRAIRDRLGDPTVGHTVLQGSGLPREIYKVGEMSCPVCKGGILRYRWSSWNGHIHAKCSTKGCVDWAE